MRGKTLLSLSNVTKSFPGVKALDEVTFSILAGEIHGLVGENGAGKSTLMAVASGALVPNEGTVEIDGQPVNGDPMRARELGLTIVRQEPSLMPDLTVAENLYLGLQLKHRPAFSDLQGWANGLLKRWSEDTSISPGDRVNTLNPEQRFIVDIVKALAFDQKVLVLDEPTEHLQKDDVARLFERIRALAAKGVAVVYISHRIREVQAIADRITVLRDGKGQGTFEASALTEDDIVSLIVGAALDREFPPKATFDAPAGNSVLEIDRFSGPGFSNVSLKVRKGEIVGLAGIDANGQREFMRALAGLSGSSGDVTVNGQRIVLSGVRGAAIAGIRLVPGDRHREGIFADLSVRENFSLRSIADDSSGSVINNQHEADRAREAVRRFLVKTPGIETSIGSLSGGNQQKVVLAGALASSPSVLLVDEPTQGVDVATRMEIYKTLRDSARRGMAIIVLSADAQEVAGLADRVMVFSRGQVVQTLFDADVTESNITSAALKSTSVRDSHESRKGSFWKWTAGDLAPIVALTCAILAMAALATFENPYYLSQRSLSGMMVLAATLAIVAYGQQLVLLIGGIDLSVGPLMGLVQVIASFYLLPETGTMTALEGWFLIIATGGVVGLVNWLLVDPLKLHPLVATLATFMGIQAVALILRPIPTGLIDLKVMDAIDSRFGFVPLTMIAAVLIAVALENVLVRHGLGIALRGFGSKAEVARVAGIPPRRMKIIGYVGCSLLTSLAAITLISQIGVGDSRAGLGYTLTSIAAAVIGGASLAGGRGSFIGALFGAIFITQVNSVMAFLNTDPAWQLYVLGAMILATVSLYSKSRLMAAWS